MAEDVPRTGSVGRAQALAELEALWSDAGRRDPFPHVRTLLAHAPVLPIGPRRAVVLGYPECEQVLRNPDVFRVCDTVWADRSWPTWRDHPSVSTIYNALNHRESPDNQPARRLLVKLFGPKQLARHRPQMEQLCHRYVRRLGEAARGGRVDVTDDLLHLPMALLATLLGFPESDLPRLRHWSTAVMDANDFNPPGTDLAAADAAVGELRDYLRDRLVGDPAGPRADLTADLVEEWPAEDVEGLVDNVTFLLGAGNETSAAMLGTGVFLLAEQPHLAALLRDRPDLAAAFTREVLRYDPPAKMTGRWVTRPTTLGGVRLPQGCMVVVQVAAAGRDPRQYPDPDRFDPFRFAPVSVDGVAQEPPRSLTLGVGPHYCVGSTLAQLTGEIVFPLVARVCAGLRVAGPVVRAAGMVVHGWDRLPVAIPAPVHGPVDPPQPAQIEGATLPDALRRLAVAAPDTGWVFPGVSQRLTAAQLHRGAVAAGRGLVAAGVRPGDRVGLLTPTGPDLWLGAFGIMLAGGSVSALPVRPMGESPQVAAARITRIVDAAGMRHVVVHPRYERLVRAVRQLRPQLRWVPLPVTGDRSDRLPDVTPDDLAVVQYTSGSTAFPKGVTLPHATVLAGLRALLASSAVTGRDSLVQWVPHHHDMGFFTALGYGLAGLPVHMFTPTDFIRRPVAFLEYLSRQQVTATTGPDYGYALMTEAVDRSDPRGLDLRRWRLAYNGAEPVRPETVHRFTETMARYGAAAGVMYPVYGLAEATLCAAFPPPGSLPRIVHVDREVLAARGHVRHVDADAGGARPLVSVGRPVQGLRLRLVDPSGVEVQDGRVGEVQIIGDPVTPGYLFDPDATAAAFDGGWLRTGDLGVRLDGDLFVAGRDKDMIVVAGRNIFAEDAELVTRTVPGVHQGRCVAFAAAQAAGQLGLDEEHLVVVAESLDMDRAAHVAADIRRRLQGELGVSAVQVHVVRRGTLPRTTSGKWQRGAARDLLAGTRTPTVASP
ncbi:cytochrome P450 [Micromonospora sp. HUAS LYJ1]|uniref:cytochrome P450 n=1 Tax=Micromonospora sp. HUAS LYJ1 TaxID=3061626 RepID=UPI002672385B|nr:cytochrome P450 [Micromonospora sp. HUAS LYJ1]WKU05587.1 cytochrome P450 [Micromonospora sp. HUAS LYJ1]